MANDQDFKLTVGIETHVQLKTKSKLFSGASNDATHAEPNTLVNHIDFGLPGALPVLNKEAIKLASIAGFALNSSPQKFSKFDRKHYFYPDLPMGYQISQYDEPIVLGGYVEFKVDSETKRVNITRAHLEADAGKSIHPESASYSLVDLNRVGTPLLEIVSEPEMHSAKEARAYVRELYLLIRYAGVSDANLYYGNMRFDVNVSVSNNDTLGTRTETKNLNSFRSVERAITYEMNRQIDLLKRGQSITQETRGWNDAKGAGYSMRSKEDADDYRYMPDPDLPPVELDDKYIEDVKSSMPKLPNYLRDKLAKHSLGSSMVESLIEGEVEFGTGHLAFITELDTEQAKTIASWIVNIEIPLRRAQEEADNKAQLLNDNDIHVLYQTVLKIYTEGQLSSTNVKELINKLLLSDKLPEDISKYATDNGLIQNSNESVLQVIIDKVIAANPKAVNDIKTGEDKAIGFLVGQVMKESKGQANPGLVSKLIVAKLRT